MEEDGFIESVDGLIKTIKDLIVKPIQRFTGFASLGLLLVVLLLTSLVFLFINKGIIMSKPKKHLKNAICKGCKSSVKCFTIVPIRGKLAEAANMKMNPFTLFGDLAQIVNIFFIIILLNRVFKFW